jgi:flagellar biosynthetic protein FlhB
MADDSDQEKTEEPTSKRLEDARKKGQIARSRELNTVVMLMTGAVMLVMLGKKIGAGWLEMMQRYFRLDRTAIFDPATPVLYFKQALLDSALLWAPFIGVMVAAAIAAPLALGGWTFSWEAIAPKFDKLNPLQGLARMFSMHGLVELLKALLKFLLIFAVAVMLYNRYIHDLMGLAGQSAEQAIGHGLHIVAVCFLILSAALIVVAAVDVPYQLWEHTKKLKMSLQEIKDEMKESEGSPEVKGRIRRLQMEMSRNRMMAEVPKADVIITNPSHYAVALKYNQNADSAPTLVAKGVDLMAAQIRTVAIGAKVPLLASPPLARALYYATDLNKEIPQGLYLAVAQVLAYVYQLKAAKQGHSPEPAPPTHIKVPEEFRQE